MEHENEEADVLLDSLDSGESREGLEQYIRLLLSDLQSDIESWENPTLVRYLEALADVVSSIDIIYRNFGMDAPVPSWKLMAEVLRSAKYYE